jgi:hypothetical protein
MRGLGTRGARGIALPFFGHNSEPPRLLNSYETKGKTIMSTCQIGINMVACPFRRGTHKKRSETPEELMLNILHEVAEKIREREYQNSRPKPMRP